MTDNKIEKQQAAILKAQERFGLTLAKERDNKRRRRDGRLLKLGVLAEQMFLAGDLTLLARFEQAGLEQFKDRKTDRLDFQLDETFNWFDKTREEAMAAKAAKGEPPKAAGPSAGAGTAATVASKPVATTSPKPIANGAAGSNGSAASGASNTTASA
jgi:hypothetical protein